MACSAIKTILPIEPTNSKPEKILRALPNHDKSETRGFATLKNSIRKT
ncbi:907_t:CDS:2, partial [Racocetra persica]